MRLKAIIFALTTCLAATDVDAQPPNIVVLTNGQVIEGQISRDVSSSTILMPSGSRLVIENDRIDVVCTSLSAAYWEKNAQLKATDLQGHTQLFHWCLQHSLVKEAQNQIDILQMMDGLKATRLEYLHRQLTVKIDFQRKRLAPRPPFELQRPPQIAPSFDVPAHDEIPDPDSAVRQVNFETETVAPLTSLTELERVTNSLPKNGVVMYKRKIEPLIVRSCYTAHCHNTRDHTMTLMRAGTKKLFPKRVSQRNLDSILAFADPNDPLNSPFFLAATSPHAGEDEPFIKRGTKQFEMLKQWLTIISSTPGIDYQPPPAITPSEKIEPQQPAPDVNTIGLPSKKTEKDLPTPPSMPSLNAEPPKKAVRRDPFDPNVFNRKYGSKKKD